MSAAPSASDHSTRARPLLGAALLLTGALVAVWAIAAVARPGTTYHLAPAVVAATYPAVRWPALATSGRRLVAVLVGTVIALAATASLHVAGLLEGPVLAGSTGLGESALVIGVAAVLGAGVALGSGDSR